MSGRRRKRWGWALLGAALIAALGLGLAAANRKALLERALLGALAERGIASASLSVEHFGADRLSLESVRIGDDDLTLQSLAVRYSLGGLVAGRLDELHIEGLEIRGSLDPSGVHLGALDALREGDTAPTSPRFLALPVARLKLEASRIVLDTADGPVVASLAAQLEADDDGQIVFDGALEGPTGLPKLTITGSHDPTTGAGRANLKLASLRLGADGLPLQDLLPSSAPLLRDAEGTLAASGEIAWGTEGWSGFADLGLRDLTLRTDAAVAERIHTAVRIEGPWPPRIAAGQPISMARLDFGLELTNGLVNYALRRDGVLEIESAQWEFAGGTIRTRGSFDLMADEQTILLAVRDVDLTQLLRLVNLEGLSGSGRLQGELPIVLRGETVEIRGGVLAASGEGGWIRYVPDGKAAAFTSTAGSAFDDLLLALQHFRYETLRFTMDGEALGEVEVGLSLHGANPEHRDGQPYEFNFNVEGQLADLVRQTDSVYQIPTRIEQRLVELAGGTP